MPPAIRVENLSKSYRIGHSTRRDSYRTLRESLVESASTAIRRWRGNGSDGRTEEFWALKGVDFEIQPGEVVGVIGRNGAGKSTLLKILSRITVPTSGRVRLRGRVGSLLEVGTGFHPELTGRENIYLNGAILGMSHREIDRDFDEIVSFAEIEKFLDTPVKRYSSGMYVRLAFAVAAHLRPEILMVDEVLAVGDVTFQKKCVGKMGEIARQGRTILFVSHNNSAVAQLTSRCILLNKGTVVSIGPTEEVVDEYIQISRSAYRPSYNVEHEPRPYPHLRRQIEFVELSLCNNAGIVPWDAPLSLRIVVRKNAPCDRFRFSFTIFRIDGMPIGSTFGHEVDCAHPDGLSTYNLELHDHRLTPGFYCLGIATGQGDHINGHSDFDIVTDIVHFEVVPPVAESGSRAIWHLGWGPVRFQTPLVERVG